jgi:glyoxylase-like metal-dependent hydrolase (beta-lactamase superfamily II)
VPCYVCVTCGVQHAESAEPPASCPICEDERQYVPPEGQQWTTLDELRREHRNRIEEHEPGLTGIGTEPSFAIGQRALLVRSPAGNILWDCITLVDEVTAAAVEALGGISAIAISHPHYYSSLVEWSRAFGGVPVYLHGDDARWLMRPDPCVVPWTGETLELSPGLTLVRLGGHFDGGAVLHWADGAEGRGALLSGDIVQVIPDLSFVSFMYSYPNLIPLPPASIRRLVAALEPFGFDRIYGAWWDRIVPEGGKDAVRRSAERYISWITREA